MIINDDEYEKSEEFYLELGEPVWLDEVKEGEEGAEGRPVLSDHPRCKIVITEDKEFKVSLWVLHLPLQGFMDRLVANANTSIMVGTSNWKQQFIEALTVEAGSLPFVSFTGRQ